ncbi:MAG: ABC-ATPase domain-containing protein [Candidatus Binatia bacterium]|nr:ABC-ATPase domain-containing protein [Candidatus Binatia bacterium]
MKKFQRGGRRREPPPRPSDDLEPCLRALDGRSYGDYRCLEGDPFSLGSFTLTFDRVQADPFAPPSRLSVEIPTLWLDLPAETRSTLDQCRASGDFLHRALRVSMCAGAGAGGSRASGVLGMVAVGQEVLDRSAVLVRADGSCRIRLTAGLPATGRRIRGRAAVSMFLDSLPRILNEAISTEALDHAALRHQVAVVEDQVFLRQELRKRGLVAFLGDGAILPRASGIDDRPLVSGLPILAPPSLAIEIELPHAGRIRGMGIPEGVTLIVGGSYHGKSTLLQAMARSVWDQIPGDGRERCVSRSETVCVRAENGRSIAGVDLRPFLRNLPLDRPTENFCTADASGATSQAAAVLESIEAGATALLVDEDTAATNFMIRDARMRRLVPSSEEPITPYLDRVRQLAEEKKVSSVLVVGGAGDYLDVADTVIRMASYAPCEVTEEAHRIAGELPASISEGPQAPGEWPLAALRYPQPRSFVASGRGRSARVRRGDGYRLAFGDQTLDLSAAEQLVDPGQVALIGDLLLYLGRELCDGTVTLTDLLASVGEDLRCRGVGALAAPGFGDRAAVRPLDLAFAINRLRSLVCSRA